MPETESRKRKEPDALTTRTGGAYIPPAKLRMMQKDIQDKSSTEFQRLAWEQLKKSINGLINKVNTSNITTIVRELIKQNLVRGRGLLCRSIMQAQSASQTFTNVYAALVAIINSKFPNIGELLLKRLVIQFRRGYKRNDKPTCLSAAKFIGHLVNQQVAHEVLGLEILTLLLEHPTEDSVEVAVAFLKEVGARLEEVSPRGAHAIFERLRHVLHEGQLDKRVQYMIEVMFQVRKDKFKDFPTLPDELDLVEEEDQFTHLLTLDEVTEGQDILNVFKVDQDFIENEDKYSTLRKEILDESEEDGSGEEEDDDDADEDEEGEGEEGKDVIIDKTETNMLALRRTIYLTIQSSLDFEECCHKILKLNLKEGQEVELCHMILDCCAQQRTYEKFFGLLAQRFCSLTSGRKYIEPFQQIFKDTYDTVHRLDTNKLRNVAKFFAHLLYTDAIAWTVMEHIKLTEDDTTSSSRIFIKILMQELSEFMGLQKLNQRLQDPTLVSHFEGLFPRDHPKNTRFSINFFTSVGLGGLTDELREFLKKQPKPTAVIAPQRTESPEPAGSPSSSSTSSSSDSSSDSSSSDSSDGSSSSDSSSSSSDSSSDSDSSSTSSSEEEDKKKRKRKQKEKAKVSLPPKKKSKDSKSKKDTKSSKPSKLKRGESSSPEKAAESMRDRRKKNKDDLLRRESQNEQAKSSMSSKRPSALDFFENDRNLYRPEGPPRYDNERPSRSRDRDLALASISREKDRGRGRKERSMSKEVAYEPLEMLRNRKRMDERKDEEEKNRRRMERSRSREAYERDGDNRSRKRKERSRSREMPSTSRESERGRSKKDRSRSRELPSTSRESERGRGRKDRSRSRELAYASRKDADDKRSGGRRNDRSRSREFTPEPPPPPARDCDDKERSGRKRIEERSRSRERECTPEPREDKERGRRRTRDDRSSKELAYSSRDDEPRRERRDRSRSRDRELAQGSQSRDKDDKNRRRREENSRSREREPYYEAREDERSSKRKQRSVSRERGYWSRDEADLSSSRRKREELSRSREERSRSREVDSERRKKSSKQKKEKDRSRSRSREVEYESRGKHKSSKRQRVDRSRSR